MTRVIDRARTNRAARDSNEAGLAKAAPGVADATPIAARGAARWRLARGPREAWRAEALPDEADASPAAIARARPLLIAAGSDPPREAETLYSFAHAVA